VNIDFTALSGRLVEDYAAVVFGALRLQNWRQISFLFG